MYAFITLTHLQPASVRGPVLLLKKHSQYVYAHIFRQPLIAFDSVVRSYGMIEPHMHYSVRIRCRIHSELLTRVYLGYEWNLCRHRIIRFIIQTIDKFAYITITQFIRALYMWMYIIHVNTLYNLIPIFHYATQTHSYYNTCNNNFCPNDIQHATRPFVRNVSHAAHGSHVRDDLWPRERV